MSVTPLEKGPSGPFFSPGDLHGYVKQEGGRTVIGSWQDCEPYLERARRLHNEGLHGSSEMKHAASLPLVLVERYCNDNGIDLHAFMAEPAHIKRMLNDPDLSGFRIWKGRI